MLKRRPVSIALAVLLISEFAGCSGCGPHAPDVNRATKVVDAWVKLIDQGSYGEAYDQTGLQFKKIIDKDAWLKQVAAYRAALGPLDVRTLENASYTDDIPGQPSGQYVILTYKTSFKKKLDSHEEITAQKEDDGVWRSLGYYVR
jgi:hypothetical protein